MNGKLFTKNSQVEVKMLIKESGADGVITCEISDLKNDERTVKSIIFRQKKE